MYASEPLTHVQRENGRKQVENEEARDGRRETPFVAKYSGNVSVNGQSIKIFAPHRFVKTSIRSRAATLKRTGSFHRNISLAACFINSRSHAPRSDRYTNQVAPSCGDLCVPSVRGPFKKYAFNVTTCDSPFSPGRELCF